MIEALLLDASQRRARGDIAGAIAACTRAVAIAPDDARGHSRLAHLMLETLDLQSARLAFENCVRIAPRDVGYRNNYGMMLSYIGDFAGAMDQFKEAIAIDRTCVPAYYNLAPITPLDDAPSLAGILESLKASAQSDLEQSMIGFALGKLYDDLGDFDRAFDNYQTGNAKKGARYVHAATLEFLKASKSAFSGIKPRSARDRAEHRQKSVFIVGMPRSGSSLIEDILARQEGVFGLGERTEISNLAVNLGQRHTSRLGYPNCAPHLSDSELDELSAFYLASVNRQAKGAPCIVDKQLLNFRHAPLLRMMFPSAAIIHCIRDPIDTCLSAWFTNFQTGLLFSFDLGDTGRYFRAYRDLMAHWEQIMPGEVIPIHYEQVVSNKDAVIGDLQERLNLPRSGAASIERSAPRHIRTSSAWQVRQPIYNRAVARWKNYEKHLGPLIDALGDLAQR